MSKKLILSDDEFKIKVIDLADDMVDIARDANAGASQEEVEDDVLEAVAEFLDKALPFDALIPGPVGQALEAADGPVLLQGAEAIAAFFKKLFSIDPEKKAERQKRRAERRRKRKARRARRRAERQD